MKVKYADTKKFLKSAVRHASQGSEIMEEFLHIFRYELKFKEVFRTCNVLPFCCTHLAL